MRRNFTELEYNRLVRGLDSGASGKLEQIRIAAETLRCGVDLFKLLEVAVDRDIF